MNPEIMPSLRVLVDASNGLTKGITDLGLAVEFCDESAVLSLAGRVPEQSPTLAELRQARVTLAGLAQAIEILENSIVKRRVGIYMRQE